MHDDLKPTGWLTVIARAKQSAIDQGGKIKHEMKLIKGFTYVVNIRTGLRSIC